MHVATDFRVRYRRLINSISCDELEEVHGIAYRSIADRHG
jgi:hypothetical protein